MDAQLSHKISEYFKTQPVDKAWVFGSFSRGEERADSDIDIMITLIPGTRMGLKFFAMNLELEELLHRPVDLVVEGDLFLLPKKQQTVIKYSLCESLKEICCVWKIFSLPLMD
ncbi:MAG: nucleotidyltransferase domain-containing protein [Bacteroidaceae bacterium]|nr:nucleotidyltransferase domain-containing protein [Bacteroidaceae bacterium]